jgi:hypothetical protein
MLSFIKKLFGFGQTPAPVVTQVPYKVETPLPTEIVEAPVVSVVAEGAGLVEVPAKPKKAKKPAAITAKPKAPAKPRAKKPKAE